MPVSLKNPPYIFTIRSVFHGGRSVTRLVQIAGQAGEIGRVRTIKGTQHKHEHKRYPASILLS
jgi:hypothetical protein